MVTTALLPRGQDPHLGTLWQSRWEKPLKNADLFVVAGESLELGWTRNAVNRSQNSRIRPGRSGYVALTSGVALPTEAPGFGVGLALANPHFWTSPKALGQSAALLARALVARDPAGATRYLANQQKFAQSMEALHAQALRRLRPTQARGLRFMDHHGEFAFFFEAYGLDYVGPLSESAALPPTSQRVQAQARRARARGVQLLMASRTVAPDPLTEFQKESGVPTVRVSLTETAELPSYVELHQRWVEAVIQASGGVAE